MKKVVKGVLLGVLFVLVLPFGMLARLTDRGLGSLVAFSFFAQGFALVPGLLGQWVRACFYVQTLREAHLDLDIGFGSFVSKSLARIGRGVLITGHTTVGHADIGDHVVIANYVSILSGRYQHNFTDPSKGILEGSDAFSKVTIGSGSFVGDHSVVMADVGERSIVGAGSVVLRPIPDYVLAVGSPARVVRERPRPDADAEAPAP